MTHRALLVDDEQGILNALRRVLARGMSPELDAYAVKFEVFDSPIAALERARDVPFPSSSRITACRR